MADNIKHFIYPGRRVPYSQQPVAAGEGRRPAETSPTRHATSPSLPEAGMTPRHAPAYLYSMGMERRREERGTPPVCLHLGWCFGWREAHCPVLLRFRTTCAVCIFSLI